MCGAREPPVPTIAANGLDIHYELTGPETAPVVAFVNALGATTDMWREQVAALGGRYRCLVYDANGHGDSSAKPMPPAIEALADDLAALLAALGIAGAHIVGASIGGMTAQAFAAKYPALVETLTLIATTPKMPEAAIWTDRAVEVRRDGLGDIAAAAMQRWFRPAFASAYPERVAETQRCFLAVDRESYALACEAIAAMDLRQPIATIAAPTLVLAAAEDPGTPLETAELLRSSIAGATLVIVPDAAHMVVIEQAKAVSAWIGAFLDLHRGGPQA
jgi:3-oxoadipate enol-lactonase